MTKIQYRCGIRRRFTAQVYADKTSYRLTVGKTSMHRVAPYFKGCL